MPTWPSAAPRKARSRRPIVNGFSTMKALLGKKPGDRSQADPGQASRPFSVDRAGFVMSEGSAMLVLATESRPSAA